MKNENNNLELRIIGGELKGRKLVVPDDIRPVTDRVKHVIFDTLGDIKDAKVLDLFAGSGNLGIEALSRGANSAVFIDWNDKSIEAINQNLLKLGVNNKAKVINGDYKKYKKLEGEKFDLVFADPPFSISDDLKIKGLKDILSNDGILILKLPSDINVKRILRPWEIVKEKKLGVNHIYFLKPSTDS